MKREEWGWIIEEDKIKGTLNIVFIQHITMYDLGLARHPRVHYFNIIKTPQINLNVTIIYSKMP